jgi:excisionase family DNA binding protein
MALISIEKAAEELDVSVRTVQRLVDSGKLRYVRVGKLMKFRPEELCLYIVGATRGGIDSKSTANATPFQPDKVLPHNRQRLSKLKLDKILLGVS